MRIFADLHHAGLFYSLHLLLEKRLKHTLYRPIGMSWFQEGFWDVAKPYSDNEGTVKQYLQSHSIPIDGTPPLNQSYMDGSKFVTYDTEHEYYQNTMTLADFIGDPPDVIIASIPSHAVTYKLLRDAYAPKAKLIFQMGNMFNEIQILVLEGYVTNLMASTIPFETKSHNVFYYQEQPLVEMTPVQTSPAKIKSFVHLLPRPEVFNKFKAALSDTYEFKAFGAGCPDGWVNGIKGVYREMQDSTFIYHIKPGGDGYGWNWHSAFINGRPLLTSMSDYRDKLGGQLFEDCVTGYDLDLRTEQEIYELIRGALGEKAVEMGKAARKRFDSTVNYEAESDKVKKFLEDLK